MLCARASKPHVRCSRLTVKLQCSHAAARWQRDGALTCPGQPSWHQPPASEPGAQPHCPQGCCAGSGDYCLPCIIWSSRPSEPLISTKKSMLQLMSVASLDISSILHQVCPPTPPASKSLHLFIRGDGHPPVLVSHWFLLWPGEALGQQGTASTWACFPALHNSTFSAFAVDGSHFTQQQGYDADAVGMVLPQPRVECISLFMAWLFICKVGKHSCVTYRCLGPDNL